MLYSWIIYDVKKTRDMKIKKLLWLILLSSIVISCNNRLNLTTPTLDVLVKKAYLLTKDHDDGSIFHPGGDINYGLIKEMYPKSKLVLVSGFQVNENIPVPVGLCVQNGTIINRTIEKMGIVSIDLNNEIFLTHGSVLPRFDSLTMLYSGSVLQVQSLVRGELVADVQNDKSEKHFIIIQDNTEKLSVKEYDGKLNNVINTIQNDNVSKALKLGGGSANGGAVFNEDGTITYIGNTNNSPYVVAVIVFE